MYALKARDKLHKREKEERRKSGDGQHGAPQRRQPNTARREAKYVGTFSIDALPAVKSDVGKAVKQHLVKLKTKDSTSCQLSVAILVNMDGVKVHSLDGRDLIMAHPLRRILYSTSDGKRHLFAMVTSSLDSGPEEVFSHVFSTAKKDQANELNEMVGKAFKASFTKKSLRRHKERIKHVRPSSTIQTPPTSPQGATPSAPPPSAPPLTSPPVSPGVLGQSEAAQLEYEVAGIRGRIGEIQAQLPAVASSEEAVFQLTVQLSSLQQQLDDKTQRLEAIQPPPPSYEGLYPELAGVVDFAAISLEDADWFQEGLPREIAMEILAVQSEGGFIVRRSSSSPGCYALSIKAPNNKIVHYLIESIPGGLFRVQGGAHVFGSLVDLIQHHTANQENLPCLLNMDTSNPAFLGGSRRDSDSDTDDVDFSAQSNYHMLS